MMRGVMKSRPGARVTDLRPPSLLRLVFFVVFVFVIALGVIAGMLGLLYMAYLWRY